MTVPAPEDKVDPSKKLETCYHLIISEHFGEVEKRVNDLLARGWQPVGSIAIAYSPNGQAHYGQAMIRN